MGGEKECGACVVVLIIIGLIVEVVKFIVKLITIYFVHILVIGGCVIVGGILIHNVPRIMSAYSSKPTRAKQAVMRRTMKAQLRKEMKNDLKQKYNRQEQQKFRKQAHRRNSENVAFPDTSMNPFVESLDRQFQEWANPNLHPKKS